MATSGTVKLDAKDVVIEYYTPRTGRRVLAVDHLNLQIVADGRHSVPTQVRVDSGDQSQTVDLPPDFDGYPWHDHGEEGQEELYVAVRGRATLELDGGETVELAAGENVARVGPGTRRRVVTGPEPVRLLIVGGVPGGAYRAKDFTELGAPDPAAS